MQYSSFVTAITDIALKAGAIIMGHYKGELDIKTKKDKSPVTVADIEASEYIVKELSKLDGAIPIVSEENDVRIEANAAPVFWLVDPLDGTKSYIKESDQFTVNIALIENGLPILGVVYIPATDELFYSGEDGHAYKRDSDGITEVISVSKPGKKGLVVVASHSHRSLETEIYMKKLPDITGLPIARFTSAASSLKFCLLAEGYADVYPRFGPTKEWDTAAGHAVLIAAGGLVESAEGGVLTYGKEKYRNPYFIAWGQKPY